MYKQVMHSAITHYPLTDAHSVPKQRSPYPRHLLPVDMLSVTSYAMKCPFGLFGSAVLTLSPPNSLCTFSLFSGRA